MTYQANIWQVRCMKQTSARRTGARCCAIVAHSAGGPCRIRTAPILMLRLDRLLLPTQLRHSFPTASERTTHPQQILLPILQCTLATHPTRHCCTSTSDAEVRLLRPAFEKVAAATSRFGLRIYSLVCMQPDRMSDHEIPLLLCASSGFSDSTNLISTQGHLYPMYLYIDYCIVPTYSTLVYQRSSGSFLRVLRSRQHARPIPMQDSNYQQ